MIEGTVTGDKEIALRLRGAPTKIQGKLREAIGRIILKLQSRVVSQKLSGQVLNVRTGTLRRSIDQVVTEQQNGVAGIVFSNLKYARRHEYGFTGSETVKAHLRMMKQAFGKPVKNPRKIEVGSFTRSVNYPAHSFMRAALKEMAPEILAQLEKAVAEGVH